MATIIRNNFGGIITVNGKTFKDNTGVIEITEDGITVNGEPIEEYEAHAVKIEIHGNVETIENTDASINVSGDVNSINTKNGNVVVGRDVLGDVNSKNGNVIVKGHVSGNATTKNGNISNES